MREVNFSIWDLGAVVPDWTSWLLPEFVIEEFEFDLKLMELGNLKKDQRCCSPYPWNGICSDLVLKVIIL
jgi:hypothetical protein